jgi:hypothetical protein
MKKLCIIGIMAVLLLAGTVSAAIPITFNHDGNLVVTYVSKNTTLNLKNEFGIFTPGPVILGNTTDVTAPQIYAGKGVCTSGEPVVLYIKNPAGTLFRSDLTHAHIAPLSGSVDDAQVVSNADGSYTVGFLNARIGPLVYDRVVMNVACDRSVPEFPTATLPVALIVGLLGAVLFIQRTREN